MKKSILIIYGGNSTEFDISIESTKFILKYIDYSIYNIIPYGINKDGSIMTKMENSSFLPSFENIVNEADLYIDYSTFTLVPVKTKKKIDIIFPIAHGKYGEDGLLQGLSEYLNIPYVGCSILASSISLNKLISKKLADNINIPILDYKYINKILWQKNKKDIIKDIHLDFKLPIFIKTLDFGSSIGIKKINKLDDLETEINDSIIKYNKIIVEQGLESQDTLELEVSFLGSMLNECPTLNKIHKTDYIISNIGSIRINDKNTFWNFELKYKSNNNKTLKIKAPDNTIRNEISKLVYKYSKDIVSTFHINSFSRIDYLLDCKKQKLYFNEINTIPGLRDNSMFIKLLNSNNISNSDIIHCLIESVLIK